MTNPDEPGDLAGEVEEWLARDPLKIARGRLLEESITEDQIVAAEATVGALTDHAVDEALAAPYPDPQSVVATEFRP